MRSDLVICLEVVMPNALHLAHERWLFPNSEWWNPVNDRFLPMFTRVLCKTQDCLRIWQKKVAPEKCRYTGFEARDLYRSEIEKQNKFLHVAGESEFKNTEAVIECWRGKGLTDNIPYHPQLTVVTKQKKYQNMCQDVPDVTCVTRVSEEDLVDLMNSHRFHLLPSAYEGFGHAIHEGIGCGAIMITTAAPPMNEFSGVVKEWGIPAVKKTPRSLAQLCEVTSEGIEHGVRRAILASSNSTLLDSLSRQARQAFLDDRDRFRNEILGLVGVS
jgi:glycosyltransferase involved in cell wall biosynthesis